MPLENLVRNMQRQIDQLTAEVEALRERVGDMVARRSMPDVSTSASGSRLEMVIGRVMERNRDVALVKKLTSCPWADFDEHTFDADNPICVWCFSGQLKEADTWMLCFRDPGNADTAGVWIGVVVKDVVGGWDTAVQPERYDCEPTGTLPAAAPVCVGADTGSHGVPWSFIWPCRMLLSGTSVGSYPGGEVTVSPPDISGDEGEAPTFNFFYWKGTVVTMTAPATGFLNWTVTPFESATQTYYTPEITITINSSTTANCEYVA